MKSFREGSVAVIQGASRGIGLGFCEKLLATNRFSRIYATGRHAEQSEGLAALRERAGDAVVPVDMDITREAAIQAAAERISAVEPRLDLMINVSGVLHDSSRGMRPEKRLEDIELENLEYSFRVNAFGPILMAKHFHRLLNHPDKAVFASLSARVGSIEDNGLGGWYAYRAAKAAQNQFSRTAAIELGRRARQTIVLALHPGTTDTDLSTPFQGRVPEGKLFSVDFVTDQLLGIIDQAGPEDSGRFLAWDGQPIPW
jgi:NAD(P)-dependent dehydrogenase (short-subunit alcohol dehydrogenase family)